MGVAVDAEDACLRLTGEVEMYDGGGILAVIDGRDGCAGTRGAAVLYGDWAAFRRDVRIVFALDLTAIAFGRIALAIMGKNLFAI